MRNWVRREIMEPTGVELSRVKAFGVPRGCGPVVTSYGNFS